MVCIGHPNLMDDLGQRRKVTAVTVNNGIKKQRNNKVNKLCKYICIQNSRYNVFEYITDYNENDIILIH